MHVLFLAKSPRFACQRNDRGRFDAVLLRLAFLSPARGLYLFSAVEKKWFNSFNIAALVKATGFPVYMFYSLLYD